MFVNSSNFAFLVQWLLTKRAIIGKKALNSLILLASTSVHIQRRQLFRTTVSRNLPAITWLISSKQSCFIDPHPVCRQFAMELSRYYRMDDTLTFFLSDDHYAALHSLRMVHSFANSEIWFVICVIFDIGVWVLKFKETDRWVDDDEKFFFYSIKYLLLFE